ncbi:MAG TPA: hypothetical protein DCW68_04720 [Rhodospirillaceae bacterium]|nr:MAG: hypothetical protein A2018_02925 [Alphaproteobacteria bacterium GWF2_58_20]HAU29399.1 hypothetical protein [Rhodospirillaceae bacterium]
MSTRQPKRISPDYLHNAALHYLDRFASSKENLRRVLMRRVLKSCRFHGDDPENGRTLVDSEVIRLEKAGLLNDTAYAEMKARSLRHRGTSTRLIRQKLALKGISPGDAGAALDKAGEEGEDEMSAARKLARKRHLGPWRAKEIRDENRQRDLASLARAGFSYDTACAVVDSDLEDAGPM